MLPDIIEARALQPYHVFLRFEDGMEGIIDLEQIVPFAGVFAPLRDPKEFSRLTVNRELGTVVWACGADLDPLVLYSRITGRDIGFTSHGVALQEPR